MAQETADWRQGQPGRTEPPWFPHTWSTWREWFGHDGFAPIPGRRADEEVLIRHVGLDAGQGGLAAPEHLVLCKSAGRRNKEMAILWCRDDESLRREDELAGCYALRTDRRDLDGEALWRLYMTLCRAEDGFRTVKSDFGLRPACHHIEGRVDRPCLPDRARLPGAALHPPHA
jgi:hypothetical protein